MIGKMGENRENGKIGVDCFAAVIGGLWAQSGSDMRRLVTHF